MTEAEARALLLAVGPNRLPQPGHRTPLGVLRSVIAQPMILLLVACTLLYGLLGNLFDAAVLGLSILAVGAISAYQELRTQRVLEALRDLSSPQSTVVRDGVVKRIASQELVPGDRLIVQEGDRLACDARLVLSRSLRVDESMLTGESVPVDKNDGAPESSSASLHAGTLVVQGDGVAIVTQTGARTAVGRIGDTIASVAPRDGRLQRELTRLVRVVALMALVICLLAAGVFAWRDASWTAGLLVGLTLAMSIVPEEFAVVWTVMLAIGAWRLAQSKVLTRQPQAIETLGTTTVLCVDKTGTLTCNRMEVAALHNGRTGVLHKSGHSIAPEFDDLLRMASLASVREGIEPMDRAVFRLLPAPERLSSSVSLQRREGVVPGRPFMRQCWQVDGDDRSLVAMKGAPEAVLARCLGDPGLLKALAEQAESWATQGLRVIGVARARCSEGAAVPESGYEAVGLIAFHDPMRDDVPSAVQECQRAGVRVVMITGDAAATALAIARDAGLIHEGASDVVLTGAQMDALDDAQLDRLVNRIAVCARVTPAQKLRIVQALQRQGDVVAMTGDGVNDGPALRAADVGVAMGERGTDVAREAAALVLLDDRFSSLVDAVRAGRRIFANLQKAMGYLFAVHVPIVGLALLPLLGGPVLLLPVHVVLLELIIDPACSLVFEAEPLGRDGMREPPRPVGSGLFGVGAATRALLIGGVALLAVVVVQWVGHEGRWSDDGLRLAGLACIVIGNIAMLRWFRLGVTRAAHANPAFEALMLAISSLSAAILLIAPLNRAFGFPDDVNPYWVLAAWGPLAGRASWRLVAAWNNAHAGPPGQEA